MRPTNSRQCRHHQVNGSRAASMAITAYTDVPNEARYPTSFCAGLRAKADKGTQSRGWEMNKSLGQGQRDAKSLNLAVRDVCLLRPSITFASLRGLLSPLYYTMLLGPPDCRYFRHDVFTCCCLLPRRECVRPTADNFEKPVQCLKGSDRCPCSRTRLSSQFKDTVASPSTAIFGMT